MVTPTYENVLEAAERLDGHARRTPLLHSPEIDALVGMEIHFKAECLQHVGAFKYRGARNRLAVMSEAERRRGVVAFSSGNHAQGVARAARELGIDALMVMPSDAPEVKVAGVRRDGADIISYDRHTESREEIAERISARDGRTIVPSYDDPYIIAGQGTVGLEIARSGLAFDALVTCIGGGGLCAGISLAMGAESPDTDIFGSEPKGYNDHQMSLRAGTRTPIGDPGPTLCDAIMTPIPGELTWPINARSLTDVFDVSDEDCLLAMRLAKTHLDVTLEPGGAAAMAAVVTGRLPKRYKRVAVILSGGNVDPEIMAMALGS
ncbi:threonine/serine dehydratase [uncultured Algimonas sp.]|uniref:threonine ammonia-lyase n=1 Tax=uncultured Algimonas sp. TaxID=1547920 RepID=UPI002613064E|nr:threonine/serine dehydratase [uncultured Algimonas sp.]